MLLFVAVSLVGLLGLMAIAIDIASGHQERRMAQTGADAGAIGGGRQIERHLDSASVVSYAFNSALRNGFPASQVLVFYPPQQGLHINDMKFVEVRIGKRIPTIFGSIFNRDSLDIQARAVAGMGTASSYCVVNLASEGLGINWDGRMTTNCGVVGNASIYLKKGIDGNPPPDVSAVGTVDARGGSTHSGVPPVPDPFSYLTVPAETSCDFTNTVVTTDQFLDPGVYCGGITVNDNILATLRPGLYIVRGGGIKGGQIEAWGGVTIINTNGVGNNQTAYKPFVFGNNCKFHIQAPSSGQYRGVAVIVDPAAPESATPNDYVNDLCGKGTNAPCIETTVDIEGLVYLPKESFRIGNSNAKLTINGTLVSKFMQSHSGAEGCFFLDTSGNSPLLRLSLVE
jgi:hypothetical protein